MMTKRNVLWLGLLVVAACAKTTSSGGGSSETHFLALCNASCEDGLSCLCGVCTETCESSSACAALSGAASCELAADGCGTPRVCEVECSDDDDCSALGASHACDEGHCRAPGGGSVEPPLRACDLDGAVEYLTSGIAYNACPEAPGSTAEDCAQVVRNTIEEGDVPVAVTWQLIGIDSAVQAGIVGIPRAASGYTFYQLLFDSAGFVGSFHPDQAWHVQWNECSDFDVADTCDAIADCFECTPLEDECGCGVDGDPRSVRCAGPAGPALACEQAGACWIDGVCYPDGETTEDGCCICQNGGYSCIEPGWCPGWTSISKRCDTENDCGKGLECRTDIEGEQGVCTRPCNFGCPTGTQCISNVPDRAGDPIGGGLCLRPCERQDDCSLEVGGQPLGSLCVALEEDMSIAACL